MSKPQINYPCEWSYTIIGAEERSLREAADQALSGKAFSIALSKKSKGGKYVSMNITTQVASEEERNGIFKKLCGQTAVKIVI